jgi:hypothetical protein
VATWWTAIEHARATEMTSWPLVAIALAYASHPRESAIDAGVAGWVEKTPTNERFLSDIRRDCPEARVVHIVRDPVAVMASRKVMEERATGGFRVFGNALGDLAESYRIAEAEAGRNDTRRYLLIRFESLVEDPEPAIATLANFLEVEDLPILHRPTSAGMSATSNSSFSALENGPIDRTRARVEVGILSPEERLRIAVAVGDAAAALGYAVPA